MTADVEADMAAQLARVREMERNGELDSFHGVMRTISLPIVSALKPQPTPQ